MNVIIKFIFVYFYRIDVFWNKCISLQKYKMDMEYIMKILLNVEKDKEIKFEDLNE